MSSFSLTSDSTSRSAKALSVSVIRRGSKSFAAASALFDSETRADVHMLYAWCRYCDDVIDGQQSGYAILLREEGGGSAAKLAELRRKTVAAVSGQSIDEPIFAGLQHVVRKYSIPQRHLFELLDGFEMDVSGKKYNTISDTLDYSYHVAGTVGVMMGIIMGVRDNANLDRAAELGIAFQLTNIARDIAEDALIGRCYLPADWLLAAGLDRDQLLSPVKRQRLIDVVARILDLADEYYASSSFGFSSLRFRSAWAVATALVVYRGIGRAIQNSGEKALDQRISTSPAFKIYSGMSGFGVACTSRVAWRRARHSAQLWSRPE